MKADRIIFGGVIRTIDDRRPEAEAVAIGEGRILAVGDYDHVSAFAGEDTEFTDLQGKTMLPGFVEPHGHPFWSAQCWGDPIVDIRAVHEPTFDAVLAKIKRRVSKAKPGELIWFLGLDAQLHEGMKEPSRELMDSLAPDVGIVIQTSNFHGIYLNSRALDYFGINGTYQPPLGGRFVNGSDGLPWKFAETAAWQILERFQEMLGEERLARVYEEWVGKFVDAGYTTSSEILIQPGHSPMLRAAVKTQKYPLRIVGYEGKHLGGDVTVPLNYGDDDFRVLGIKLHADGSVLLGNVWTTQPYLNTDMTLKGMGLPRDSTGHANLSEDKLYELVSRYAREGWQVSVHSHGDRTIDMALDVYERVIGELGADAIAGPYRLEHCGLMREDQIDRAIKLGVVSSYFLPYIFYWGEALRDNLLGEAQAAGFVPAGSAIRKGMRASFHCDSPMTWPSALTCLHVATTRKTLKGAVLGPEQRVSMADALKAITIDAAYHLRMDDRIGSIEVGKYADFVILAQDPLEAAPDEILNIRIVSTILAGRDTRTRPAT